MGLSRRARVCWRRSVVTVRRRGQPGDAAGWFLTCENGGVSSGRRVAPRGFFPRELRRGGVGLDACA